jgi:7-keto-8-aminopelargonate synthetase-like enzyme
VKKTLRSTGRVRSIAGSDLAEPLQQVDRTCVLHRGRKLAYFAGCDYFRLASHPEVLHAIQQGLDHYGLNVAASRKTTGNHPLYEELEKTLARFFGVESALMVSNGYLSNMAVAQALAGDYQHVLVDERAHGSLLDAIAMLGVPITTFAHRDVDSARKRTSRLLGHSSRHTKLLLATDGLFSHSGEVAPLDEYLDQLPSNVTLLVDDAHGAGTLGKFGRGTPEHLGLKPQPRLIHTITLSKAFGVYGGAILGPESLRRRIIARSRLFAGNTPLPLPLVSGVIAALKIVSPDPKLRRRLCFNTSYIKAALRAAGKPVNDGPGPIIPLHPRNGNDVARLKRTLLTAGIHPPYINYLGGPKDGYFRLVVSSEHTAEQLDALVHALTKE